MKNKLPLKATVRKQTHDVLLESGCEARIMPLAGITDVKISEALDQLGYVDEEPVVSTDAFTTDDQNNDQKPRIVDARHDSEGALILKTIKPSKEVTIQKPWIVEELQSGFNKLGVSADDYLSFCELLRREGLPSPSNAATIGGTVTRDLTIKNLNEFGFPIEKPEIDPSLFVDEKLSIPDLFEFEIDLDKPLFHIDEETRKSIQELFEFNPEKKQK